MSQDQFTKFTSGGYFTIRRNSKFWSGNFTDQTIEQVLMRMLKAPGGLAHGRGITPSTQAKLVHVLPRCVPICSSLEEFCGVHTQTSDQHYDLRESSTARDHKHFTTAFNWLKLHSPFSYSAIDGLVSISTGIIAEKSANADKAFEIGKEAADSITGQSHGEVKLKRKDTVTSMSKATGAVTVRGEEAEVNSTLL